MSNASTNVTFSPKNNSSTTNLAFTALPPLSLYIHFPWCVKKCPYCDFNSHTQKTTLPYSDYIDSLILDLEYELPNIWGRSTISIFMGGGTPSLFPASEIERLIQALRARLNFSSEIEITLEANPGTVDQENFKGFKDAGVTRLSIGVQSFNDQMLEKLGRIHNSQQALTAIQIAKDVGFSNFNLDLMYGLPGQTMQQMLEDLQIAIEQQSTHLSHYQLTIEPNTLFHAKPPTTPSNDSLWGMTQAAHTQLASNDFAQYEVSAFSKPNGNNNYRCQHNLNYWQFGDYLGIGAGAHQKISFANTQSISRCFKQKHPEQYMQQVKNNVHVFDLKNLTKDDIVFEFMLNALRLNNGFNTTIFSESTGLPISSIQKQLVIAQKRKWLTLSEDNIRPTELGMQYLNDVISLFL